MARPLKSRRRRDENTDMTAVAVAPELRVARPRAIALGIASVVLGIVWAFSIASVLALVVGYKAKQENAGALATTGIVLGWVGVGTVALALVVALGMAAG